LQSSSRTGKDDVFELVTHLLAECGEVADDIKGMEGKKAEDPSNYTKKRVSQRISYGINLDDYWNKRLVRIRNIFK
jgi:hypothetical protein